MAVEHRDLPESGLHEPKGASLAASDRVYISDGAGSGTWAKVDADTLQGVISNATAAGLRVVTDGSGGFTTEPTPASSYGTMNLTNNTTVKALTAASDATLNTNTDYTKLDISLEYDSLVNMTSGTGSLVLQASGVYAVDFWAGVKSSVNSTKFALKFVVNGTDFVAREIKLTLGTNGQIYNMSGNGLHSFTAGDTVELYIAADKNANITIEDMTFQLLYLGP
tara:strand:+ start:12838 stop:13506 length:669 start_codon:yes stop_codon:yes gene_type:complete